MTTLWIVHRDAQQREALRVLSGAGPDAVAGAPGDPRFDTSAPAEVVLLGLAGDFEQELEFAHRAVARLPDAAWILLADRADLDDARRLFDTLPAEVLPFPVDGRTLRGRVRSARVRRRADALSQRLARDAIAARFARWFADLELPEVMRVLDPNLASVPLLIRGEPGTGRGLLGAYVHSFGGTTGGQLAPISCIDAGVTQLLAEITRGASSPAARRAITLLLEDVDLLPPSIQRRLRGWVEGGLPDAILRTPLLRWIGTCGEDGPSEPSAALDPGLAQALGGLVVRVPPLRERVEAIERLASDTALAWCTAHGERPHHFDAAALAALRSYPWPGNLRELEGVVTRTLAAGCSEPIRAGELRLEGGVAFVAPLAPAEAKPALETERKEAAPEAVMGTIPTAPEDALPAAPEPEIPEAQEAPRPEPERAQPAIAEAGEAPQAPVAVAEESLRRLIGAVAHEVRNPLVAIRTFSKLLPERFEDPQFRTRFAGIVGGDVRRIEQVVDRLARFAALGAPEQKPVDVAAVLDELLERGREEIQARRLVVLKELDRDRPWALGDPAHLQFAFEALVGKALELVPERGDVYVASRHHPDALRGGPSLRVLLRFGCPEEILPSAGVEGVSVAETALEMVMADAIVRSHGGTFTATPGDARETVVVIDLPAPE